jgi:hypothetical protein
MMGDVWLSWEIREVAKLEQGGYFGRLMVNLRVGQQSWIWIAV